MNRQNAGRCSRVVITLYAGGIGHLHVSASNMSKATAKVKDVARKVVLRSDARSRVCAALESGYAAGSAEWIRLAFLTGGQRYLMFGNPF